MKDLIESSLIWSHCADYRTVCDKTGW